MPRNMTKPNPKDKLKAIVVEKVTLKHHVKKDYVYKVINAARESDSIFSDYMTGYENLLKAVKELVPFN